MTKVKESVERVEDLKAQVGEILGATGGLDDGLIKSIEETFIEEAKKIGEEAGTKLMIPMFLMLAVVFLIVMVPALLSIQI